ncbi:UDP-N-acetylmuramate--L-alanine ligase [Carboxydocella sp. ULO1]|uniref:UDP-N-acetylmuramate--L-alanine ligase n=1 Tax=Carboxydocella sp. ULO1 TaxID=1926599 RepID=UPI0009C4B0FA|nr:UDP-N-acetylmuramate--L-alanine ligase [Carboxydocella sp. ULO1]GAW28790.1 UDP-N-acetylmuramate--L-alanine ligase [Carboxydocella sp. ULO1]
MKEIKGRVHFIGIGGSGMSGLAELLLGRGHQVSGSDVKASQVTAKLERMGARVSIGHRAELVEGAELVVVSTAIRPENPELVRAQLLGLPIWHRSDLLAWFMQQQEGIGIAGAHGKTTTTGMVATMLLQAGLDPTVVVGGTFRTIGGNARLGQGRYLVAEADESDGSFLKLPIKYGVVTNIEADHLDYYGDLSKIITAFRTYLNRLPGDGLAVLGIDNPLTASLAAEHKGPKLTYGFAATADYRVEEPVREGAWQVATVYEGGQKLGQLRLAVPGRHNAVNALAAVALGRHFGLAFPAIADGLAQFQGVMRRFETLGRHLGIWVVDDYAHHPTEVQATLKAARQAGPRRLVACFQPHRYTRTKFLGEEFAQSFAEADLVLLTDIYSAGEDPIPGVSTEVIIAAMPAEVRARTLYCPTLPQLKEKLLQILQPGDLVLTMGAGNIRQVGEELAQILLEAEKEGRQLWTEVASG